PGVEHIVGKKTLKDFGIVLGHVGEKVSHQLGYLLDRSRVFRAHDGGSRGGCAGRSLCGHSSSHHRQQCGYGKQLQTTTLHIFHSRTSSGAKAQSFSDHLRARLKPYFDTVSRSQTDCTNLRGSAANAQAAPTSWITKLAPGSLAHACVTNCCAA